MVANKYGWPSATRAGTVDSHYMHYLQQKFIIGEHIDLCINSLPTFECLMICVVGHNRNFRNRIDLL